LLILVRATLTDDSSLVLTELENEELAIAIERLSPAIEQVTTAVTGRSVVIIGANPRDQMVRRLARRLIRPRTNQGPAFFICPKIIDKAYWDNLNVIWIEAEPAEVVAKLTGLLTS
jgi:hypothetical protein